jgi:hypothetical protein
MGCNRVRTWFKPASDGICPCHQDEVRVCFGIGGGFHPIDHLRRTHNFLVWAVTTTLCLYLIFDMYPGGTRPDHLVDGFGDHKRISPTGIGVNEKRKFRCAGDAVHIFQNIVQGGHPYIWKAVGSIRHTPSRKID